VTGPLILRSLVVALAFAAATAVGWWGIPVAAAVFGAITWRDRSGPIVAGLAAILAWSGILVWDALSGPTSRVAAVLGGVLQVHPVAIYVLTLAFAGLLALCSAIVARSLARATTKQPS
jgi:hypothetical protein